MIASYQARSASPPPKPLAMGGALRRLLVEELNSHQFSPSILCVCCRTDFKDIFGIKENTLCEMTIDCV